MFQSYNSSRGAGCRRHGAHEVERQRLRSCQGHPHPRHRNLRDGRRHFRRSFWDYPKSYVFRKYGFQYFCIALLKKELGVFLELHTNKKGIVKEYLSTCFLACNIERRTNENMN